MNLCILKFMFLWKSSETLKSAVASIVSPDNDDGYLELNISELL